MQDLLNNKTIDYDEIARYEAAIELISIFESLLISLRDKYRQYDQLIEDRLLELGREEQELREKDTDWVNEIRDTYAPLVRQYYNDPDNFKLSKEFIETKTSYAKKL